jgi:hypothetical protein
MGRPEAGHPRGGGVWVGDFHKWTSSFPQELITMDPPPDLSGPGSLLVLGAGLLAGYGVAKLLSTQQCPSRLTLLYFGLPGRGESLLLPARELMN